MIRARAIQPILFTVMIALVSSFLVGTRSASAEISFLEGSEPVTLTEVIDDEGAPVFIFDGTSDGETVDLTFETDSDCPGVAMTGGAEFIGAWSCSDGVITATVTDRGGLSFGPGSEDTSTFYVSFGDAPAPPGAIEAPDMLSGIQLAVFGDVNRWNLDGEITPNGAAFGVELSGPEGGSVHFRMELPAPAVEFLGGVLGVFVGGKPDPFAAVTTNDDGSVSIAVDITGTVATKGLVRARSFQKQVTRKITAGARVLSVGFPKPTAQIGKSTELRVCAGANFTEGDKMPVQLTSGGKALKLKRSITLDSAGCGQSTVSLKGVKAGKVLAKVSYEGQRAQATLTVKK